MGTTTWRTARSAVLAGMALLASACAALPDSTGGDPSGRPAPQSPPSSVPPPGPTAGPPASYASAQTRASIGECELFPPDHFLNAQHIDRLPVHPKSATWTSYLARDGATLKVPSSSVYDNARGGMPINVVDSRTQSTHQVMLNQSWTAHNYNGRYPIPKSPRVEGHPSAQWDRHLLIVDVADCNAYELIQYDPFFGSLGLHTALSGVRYPLDSNVPPRITTNAADTPMIGQYAMADEVKAGKLTHAIGFCTTKVGPEYVWPARNSDGTGPAGVAPPMGAWIRLRGDVNLKAFTGQARTIATGLRDHGMILTDTCGHQFSMAAENSDQWSNEVKQLRTLSASDFEFVDTTPMKHSATSFEVN